VDKGGLHEAAARSGKSIVFAIPSGDWSPAGASGVVADDQA